MFDVGFWELAIIGVVALVIVGPERLPGLARTAGLWVGKARRMVADVKRDIDRELKASEMSELSSIKKDLDKAGDEMRKVAEEAADASGLDETGPSLKQAFKDAAPIEEELDELDKVAKEFSDELEQTHKAADGPGTVGSNLQPSPESSQPESSQLDQSSSLSGSLPEADQVDPKEISPDSGKPGETGKA